MSDGYAKAVLAGWNFLVNGQELTDTSSMLPDSIQLIPQTNLYPDDPYKIQPGQTGYFDICIDPSGTEVSFSYTLTVDISNLPDGFKIRSYSVNGDSRKPLTGPSVTGSLALPGPDGVFTSNDSQTVRCFWEYPDDPSVDDVTLALTDYAVSVSLELEQVL